MARSNLGSFYPTHHQGLKPVIEHHWTPERSLTLSLSGLILITFWNADPLHCNAARRASLAQMFRGPNASKEFKPSSVFGQISLTWVNWRNEMPFKVGGSPYSCCRLRGSSYPFAFSHVGTPKTSHWVNSFPGLSPAGVQHENDAQSRKTYFPRCCFRVVSRNVQPPDCSVSKKAPEEHAAPLPMWIGVQQW